MFLRVNHRTAIDPDRGILNIARYRNTTAGTIPPRHWNYERRFRRGDHLLLATFGAGFTRAALLLRRGYDAVLAEEDASRSAPRSRPPLAGTPGPDAGFSGDISPAGDVIGVMEDRDDNEDRALLGRAAAGDAEAFGRLVVRHRPQVLRVARRVLCDPDEAEDAAQETFVRAFAALPSLDDPDRFPAWLARIARNLSLNRLRRRPAPPAGPSPEALSPDPGPAREAEVAEFAAAVRRAIFDLPPGWRDPVALRHLEDLPLSEIARRLGLREGAVRTRLGRARRELARRLAAWPPETIARMKEARGWLPARLAPNEEVAYMPLFANETRHSLPRGERSVTVRPLRREDRPALRRFDRELALGLAEANAAIPPGGTTSVAGGPWSDDDDLTEHFEAYESRGNLTLVAEDGGRIVGFADLWVAREPAPFGESLDVECIDYFREHWVLGLERVLLEEAERVARAAGLPALDIGTNTASGDYPSLRRFGLRVFYEYDDVIVGCPGPGSRTPPPVRPVTFANADLSGLLRVSRWAPTDFRFGGAEDDGRILAFEVEGTRALLDLRRYKEADGVGRLLPVPPHVPNRTDLWTSADALCDPASMSRVLAASAAIAAGAGAEEIALPAPADLEIDPGLVDVRERRFAYAWLRKPLPA